MEEVKASSGSDNSELAQWWDWLLPLIVNSQDEAVEAEVEDLEWRIKPTKAASVSENRKKRWAFLGSKRVGELD